MEKTLTDEVRLSAMNFGFDPTWILDTMEKYGTEVITLVVEAARHGLSITTVVELLQKYGPALLQFIVSLFNKKAMMGVAGDIVPDGGMVEGLDAAFLDVIIEKYLPMIVSKYLPLIFEKYGEQFIQMIINLFIKSFQK